MPKDPKIPEPSPEVESSFQLAGHTSWVIGPGTIPFTYAAGTNITSSSELLFNLPSSSVIISGDTFSRQLELQERINAQQRDLISLNKKLEEEQKSKEEIATALEAKLNEIKRNERLRHLSGESATGPLTWFGRTSPSPICFSQIVARQSFFRWT
jgi:hypothetical protein